MIDYPTLHLDNN